MSIPTWLQAILIQHGHLTESGLGRKAKLRPCRKCGAPTINGLDAPVCAFEASTDPGQLNNEGEANALLAGRRTYEIAYTSELRVRRASDITSRPAATTTVLAEHYCHQPIPATWCQPPPPAAKPGPKVKEIPY